VNSPSTRAPSARLQEATRQLRKGRRNEASAIYEEVVQQAGNDIALRVQLGHFCREFGALDQAIEHYAMAVEHNPNNAPCLAFLGGAHEQNGQLEKALDVYERAMAIDAEIPSVLKGLGMIRLARKDYARARKHLERAEQLKPSDADVQGSYAVCLTHLNEREEALKHAHKAAKLDPANPSAQYVIGEILSQLGRTDEAIRHFEKTIRQHKTFGAAYDLLARMRKFTEADKPFIEKTEAVLKAGMPAEQRYSVHYALGKIYDDCRDWDKAFEHFRQANLLKKKVSGTDGEEKLFRQIKKAFDALSLEKYRAFGHPSKKPVFIVGMPRSGTTLIEQMIASHPRAAGAGELMEIPRIANLVSPRNEPRRLVSKTRANLTPENIKVHAESYLSVLEHGREDADRIVDKLPGNYYFLGLISVLFPNATIVHAVRHPLDTCLSCYFQNFIDVGWANDFKQIGEIYRLYRDIMEHWKRVLPAGKIVEVQYERLIEDPENEARRIVESCGLEWNSSILRYYEQERAVNTASLWQVRQPVYRSSKSRWKNYASHLGELADALSPYLQDERQELKDHGIDLKAASRIGWIRRLVN
jgi:Flp pilus assembly protein TadD